MKAKIVVFVLCILVFLLGCFAGCGQNGTEETGTYTLYYLNNEKTKVVAKGYDPKATEITPLIEELITQLCQEPEDVEYEKILDGAVKISSFTLENK